MENYTLFSESFPFEVIILKSLLRLLRLDFFYNLVRSIWQKPPFFAINLINSLLMRTLGDLDGGLSIYIFL